MSWCKMAGPSSLTTKLQLALMQAQRPKARQLTSHRGQVCGSADDPAARDRQAGDFACGQQAILDHFAFLLNDQGLEENRDLTLSDRLAYEVMHNELSGLVGAPEIFRDQQTPLWEGGSERECVPQSSRAAPDLSLPTAEVVASGDALQPPSLEEITSMFLACADAILRQEKTRAIMLVRAIRAFASCFGCDLQRLSHYVVEALAAKLSNRGPQLMSDRSSLGFTVFDSARAFEYVTSKIAYYPVAYYFQNSVFLEALEGVERVHILSYGIGNGYEWPGLMQALASRPQGPPKLLRITGIEFPQKGSQSDRRVKGVGRRLARVAAALRIPFQYNAISSNWEDVQVSSLALRDGEVLLVSSLNRLQHLMDESVTNANPRGTVLNRIRSLNPRVFVTSFSSFHANGPSYIHRLREILKQYACYFEITERLMPRDSLHRLHIETYFIGRDLFNLLACEGKDRHERHEHYTEWHRRLVMAGFEQVSVGAQVFVTGRDFLLQRNYHGDWIIGQDHGWLLVGWKDAFQMAMAAWRPRGTVSIRPIFAYNVQP